MNDCSQLASTGVVVLPAIAIAVVILVAGIMLLAGSKMRRAGVGALLAIFVIMVATVSGPATTASAACPPANAAPALAADTGVAVEDSQSLVSGDVLANDTDRDGDTLRVTTTGTFTLAHGTLVMNADGTWTYTLDNSDPAVDALNTGQTLTDSFTYTVSDGHGHSPSGVLTITINGHTDNRAPIAVNDLASVKEDTAPSPVTGNVLTNDTDADADALSVTNPGTFNVGHGSLVINSDGTYGYTLDNSDPAVDALNDGQQLTDTFTYNISDGHGGTSSATLTISINGTTDPEIDAEPDVNSVREDAAPNLITGNVLTNDTDSAGHSLAVTNAGTFTLSYGALVIHADGSYTYTLDNSNPTVNALNTGDELTDTFHYSISDGHGNTASTTLTVTIKGTTDNRAPFAAVDAASVKEDTAPNPISGNVLTNDSDADGDTLSVTNAGTFTLTYGSLVVQADGSYSYTLANGNPTVDALNDGQQLTDTFTYNISDGRGGTDSSTLTITINGTTDVDTLDAQPDGNSVKEDTAPNLISGNVLTNDTDSLGHAISLTNAGTFTMSYGSLVIHADGSYTYTLDNSNPAVDALNNGQHLTDTFTYNISDGHGNTASASLTVTVNGSTDNSPPVAVVDAAFVKEDASPNPVTGNVLTNDSDSDGDSLSVTNAGTFNLGHGSLEIHADGSYSYTLDNANVAVDALNDGQTVTDTFTYNISDGHGGTDSSVLTVTANGTTD